MGHSPEGGGTHAPPCARTDGDANTLSPSLPARPGPSARGGDETKRRVKAARNPWGSAQGSYLAGQGVEAK